MALRRHHERGGDIRAWVHAQGWLTQIAKSGLSRNSLKHVKSVLSGMFKLAKQQNYFDGINPAHDTACNPSAPEPAATAFAVAGFAGLRHGEIQGLCWQDIHDGEIFVSRSIWNGRIGAPKTRKSRAGVPIIRQLAERLAMHRIRCGSPTAGANGVGKVTFKQGDQLIKAECFTAWSGHWEQLRPDPVDDCSDFPLGPVELIWPAGSSKTLYFFPQGKSTENVLETVQK